MSGYLQVRDRPGPQQAQLPIDPRIAARRNSVRTQQIRRRTRSAIGVLAVVTALVGVWLLTRSPVLAVHRVVVSGTVHTGRGALLAVAGLDRGPPMLGVDLAGIRRRVEALPWVSRARVGRRWPTTVTIDVTERVPGAQLGGTAGQPAVVDLSGRVLATGDEAARIIGNRPTPLPVIQGTPTAGGPGTTVVPESRAALQILAALHALTSAPAVGPVAYSTVSVTQMGPGMLSATLAPGVISVIFGSTEELGAKLVALRTVLSQVASGAVATIDVRVAQVPVLTDGKKSSSVSTTQRG